MSDTELLKTALPKTVHDAYKDAAQPLAKEVGKFGQLIGRAVNLVASPIDYIVTKGELAMQSAKEELKQRVEKIPPEFRQEPKLNIAIPAVEGLKVAADDEELKNLFLSLLEKSMDSRQASSIIPAYAKVIQQMSADEARLLLYIYPGNDAYPIVSIYRQYNDASKPSNGGEILVERNLTLIGFKASCTSPQQISIYLDNLQRLGLIFIPEDRYYILDEIYKELEESDLVLSKKADIEKTQPHKCRIKRGVIELTDFGKGFCKACSIDKMRVIDALAQKPHEHVD